MRRMGPMFFFFSCTVLRRGDDPLVGLKFTSYTSYAYSTHGLLLELAQNTRAQKQSQIPSPTVSKVLSLWYTCCLSVTWVWGVWLYWIRAHSIWTGLDCQGFLNPSIFQGHYDSVPVGHISKNVRGCVPFGQGSKHVERGGPFPQELHFLPWRVEANTVCKRRAAWEGKEFVMIDSSERRKLGSFFW